MGDAAFRFVVDTGASSTLSCSKLIASKIRACTRAHKVVTQVGVHKERICSDMVLADVRIGGLEPLPQVPILINDAEVEGSDGYVGIAVLKYFDIWIEPHRIGFRRNEKPVDTAAMARGARGECSADSASLCQITP